MITFIEVWNGIYSFYYNLIKNKILFILKINK